MSLDSHVKEGLKTNKVFLELENLQILWLMYNMYEYK
jgi:hypothetical protein